jgi:hypothetical protein
MSKWSEVDANIDILFRHAHDRHSMKKFCRGLRKYKRGAIQITIRYKNMENFHKDLYQMSIRRW